MSGRVTSGLSYSALSDIISGCSSPRTSPGQGGPYAAYTRVGKDRLKYGELRPFLPVPRHVRGSLVPVGCTKAVSDPMPPNLVSPARSFPRASAEGFTALGDQTPGLVDRRVGACHGARTRACDQCGHHNTSGRTDPSVSRAIAHLPHLPVSTTRPRSHLARSTSPLRAAASPIRREALRRWRGPMRLPPSTGSARASRRATCRDVVLEPLRGALHSGEATDRSL